MGHPKSSVKYGTGQYDSQAHGGTGKGQKKLSPTAGQDKGATPNVGSAPVRDGAQGHGSIGRSYQQDAHTGLHHGKHGEAVGHTKDLHQQFTQQLYSEGRGLNDSNPGFVDGHSHGTTNKAEHHPRMSQAPHKFERLPSKDAHGYGHQPSTRSGHLRMSGHSKGHQVGKR